MQRKSLIDRYLPLMIFISIVIGTLSVLTTMTSCGYAKLQTRSTWIRDEAKAIADDAIASGTISAEDAAQLQALDAEHASIDDTIQSHDSWAGLLGPVIGSLATAIPGGPLIWSIASGIWRRRLGSLVTNVQRASNETSPHVRTLNIGMLGILNKRAGLQPHIDKPLAAAKAEEVERKAA